VKKEKQMTVPPGTDASFNPPGNWKAIDWMAIRQQVRRLQVRIAKATQLGKHRRVSALQWLLTHSRAAKLLAVWRVTTNRGAKTPGVDNVVWRTNKQKFQAAENLKRHGYRPKPLRRLYIPKKNGKLRPLSIPTMHDRAMQALYALALAPVAETLADPNSYGFREVRCCADALTHAHIVLSRKHSPQWVLEGDIRACFDEISHAWLLQHVPMDKQILRKYLPAAKVKEVAHLYGMAVAYTMVDALRHSGAQPTRASLLRAATHLNEPANPFFVKGIAVHTGPNDYYPVERTRMLRFHAGRARTCRSTAASTSSGSAT